ncbi:4Fe-4S dicluster domain-containing protein [Chloroflexota bacterium]
MKVITADPSACTACRSCEAACATYHEGTPNGLYSRIRVLAFMRTPEPYLFYPHVCMQCETPYCAMVCAPGALQKNKETGVIEYSREKCIGCKLCVVACPYGAMTMHDGVPAKCDLCDGDPQCVKACTFDAIKFGEPEKLAQDKRVVISRAMQEGRSVSQIQKQPKVRV